MTLLIALVPLLIASMASTAATYYSRASGNWTNNTTWSTTSGGSAVGDGIYPVAGDTAIIEGACAVIATVTEACGSVQIGSTGTLTLSSANTFGGVTLSPGGLLNLNIPGALGGAPLTINGGTIDNTSAVDITLSPSSPQNWNGDFAYAGGTHSLNLGAAAVALGNNCTVTVNGNTLTVGGPVSGAANLTKAGAGTLTFTGANTYTGTTTIKQGIVKLNGQTGRLDNNSGITFAGTGTFNYDNLGSSASMIEVVGTLTLSAGEATIQSTRTAGFNTTLTFSSLASRAPGATANFVATGTGSGPSVNQATFTGQAKGFINQGMFCGGTGYAYMDAKGTYVRSINYGTPDQDSISVGGGNTIGPNNGKHVQMLGPISAQTSISILTLRIPGNYDFALAANQTLTLSSGGLLKSGGGAAILSGGTGLTTGGSTELVIRTDQASDSLTISTPILSSSTGGLTKSGAGTLILSGANAYTGDTTVNAGTLELRTASGLSDSDKLLVYGTAVVNLNFTGTDTIGGLVFDGVPQAGGTWGSATSSATHKDARFTGSGILNVGSATTTTMALTSGSNPSTYGDTLTFTATVSGTRGTPTGDVTFKDGATTLGTAPLNDSGVATFSINTLSAGAHSAIAAVYLDSTSPNLSQTVNAKALSITANADSKTYGQTKTYGSGQTAFTTGAGELVASDAVSSVSLTCPDGAPATAAVGSYALIPTGAVGTGLANYNITYHNGTLTVTPASTANAVVSSLNPARPGAEVTFTATLSSVPPGAGVPTGTVRFLANGFVVGGPVALVNGQASIAAPLLPHGFSTVVAEYAGDGNFLGKTNSLSPDQVVNTPPVKGTFTLGAIRNQHVDFSAAKLAKTAADADHDPLSITAVMGSSAQGGTVALNGSTIRYTPPTDLVGVDADTLYYTVSDCFGGADTTGTIAVTILYADAAAVLDPPAELPDRNKEINACGIPGYTYLIQATAATADPVSWITIGTNAADPSGKIVFSDLNATNYNSRFYRLAAP